MPLHEERDGFQIFNPGSPTERRRAPAHTMGVATVARRAPAFELVELGCPMVAPAMDLSLFFAGTAGSVPTGAARAARAAPARGRRPAAVRLRRGDPAPAAALGRAARLDAVFLTHYHADHWLGLLGMLKTFDLRGREKPLDALRPARPARAVDAMRPVFGRTGYPLALDELEPHEEVRFGGYVVGRVPGRPPRHRVRLRVRRGRPARPLRRRGGAARSACAEGPDFGRLQRGRDGRRRAARAGHRPGAPGPPDRHLRRHAAVPDRRRSTRTGPTCSSTRRRSSRTSASARARPRTRPRARRPSSRATPACGCSR